MRFASLVQVRCSSWLLKECWGAFQPLQSYCLSERDAHQGISSHCPTPSPAATSSNPLPTGSSTTQFRVGSMLLHMKRCLPSQFSFSLVWNQLFLPRLCAPQVVWPQVKPGTTRSSEHQVPSLYTRALSPTALPGWREGPMRMLRKRLVNCKSVDQCYSICAWDQNKTENRKKKDNPHHLVTGRSWGLR